MRGLVDGDQTLLRLLLQRARPLEVLDVVFAVELEQLLDTGRDAVEPAARREELGFLEVLLQRRHPGGLLFEDLATHLLRVG